MIETKNFLRVSEEIYLFPTIAPHKDYAEAYRIWGRICEQATNSPQNIDGGKVDREDEAIVFYDLPAVFGRLGNREEARIETIRIFHRKNQDYWALGRFDLFGQDVIELQPVKLARLKG